MIGWLCDFYYTKTDFANVARGTRYPASTFILTDSNRYFTAVTEADPSQRPPEGERVIFKGVNVESREKLVSYLQGWFGKDYYNIYGPRGDAYDYDGRSGELTWLNYSIPSARTMFPNWNNMKPSDDIIGHGWHFKNLNKLLIFNHTNSPYGFYLDNGEWVLDYIAPGFFYFSEITSYSARVMLMYLGGDILKGSSWGGFSAGYTWGTGGSGFEAKYNGDRTSQLFDNFLYWLFTNEQGTAVTPDVIGDQIPPDNPFEPGGPSEPGDLPPGTFDGTSDIIPDSSLPTISAANTGFTRIYNPSLAQVQELARYLWTDDTVLETIWNKIRQYFENPMDAIIGFNLVPVAVPNGGTKNFALMYIDTGVSMTAAASQFVDQDCGSVKLERYYGSALDQSPYTKVSCFLPYIGTVQLNTDEVMGTTLQVKYRIDIVSGSCVAKILVDSNVLYQYSGHCAINIPFSSSDFSTYVSAAISVAKLAVGAAAAGAAGVGAVGVADVGQQTNQVTTLTKTTTDTVRNPTTGRQIITGTHSVVETYEEPVSESSTKASFSGLSPANISNTVGQIMASKPNVEHSGSFSGNTGYLGVRRPFLIIERPNMCLPKNYQVLNGYPSMITMKLGDCSGYTRIQQVQLTGMTATNPEQAEILSLLKSGVIF